MSPSAYKVVQCAVFALLVLAMSALPALPIRAAGADDIEAAFAVYKRGQYAEAIKLVDKAIQSGGLSTADLAWAYNTRGLSHEEMDRLEEAIADYSVALKIVPSYSGALHNRGNVYSVLSRYKLAFADYNAALKLKNSNKSDLYYARAGALLWQGNYEKAIAGYDQALAINPENPNRGIMYLGRGNAYFLLGDYGRAIDDYERSLDLNPRHKGAKQRIARAREAMKRAARPGYTSDRELWADVGLERPGDKN